MSEPFNPPEENDRTGRVAIVEDAKRTIRKIEACKSMGAKIVLLRNFCVTYNHDCDPLFPYTQDWYAKRRGANQDGRA